MEGHGLYRQVLPLKIDLGGLCCHFLGRLPFTEEVYCGKARNTERIFLDIVVVRIGKPCKDLCHRCYKDSYIVRDPFNSAEPSEFEVSLKDI